ncbi:MAG: thiamine pyrophosphate-dependent dehydrogenase E1 component subunit alpha, partial [Bacteroidales bacterium]
MKQNKQDHLETLRQMLRIRHFEENLYQMYLAKQVPGMSPHLSVGQEAVAVGVCQNLKTQDYVLTTHRGHGHVLAKGANMNRMLAEILGKETGYCHGRGGSMHIADVKLNIVGANGIVGGGLPIAVGVGLSCQYLDKNAVVACFFGDAATNIGAFHESLNMAAVMKLPVIWICENNKYGLSTNIKKMLAGGSIAARGAAYGIPGVRLDGNDVLAVHVAAKEAIERARAGQGPTLIEAETYRWYGHGASDNRSYRTREEESAWKENA